MHLRVLSSLPLLLPLLLLPIPGRASTPAASSDADTDHGAYLSLEFGDGHINGGNASGDQWMRHSVEIRAGRQLELPWGSGRADFVYYNEGHPDNNHRDGFALQAVAVRALGERLSGEVGLGPYINMNTTVINGREIDDVHWGLLLSAALRYDLAWAWPGTQLRIGYNHAQIENVHRSDSLLVGIGRQFGPSAPAPDTEPVVGPWWLGGSVGNSITSIEGTHGSASAVLEAKRYLDGELGQWAASAKFVFEGDDGVRVDRRGVAGQVWYVQQVTPRFTMSAGIGPYIAKNRRDDSGTRGNVLISFQAERALSRVTRVFASFNRVRTFREAGDRDMFQLGMLKAF